jgi:hypothetical protein
VADVNCDLGCTGAERWHLIARNWRTKTRTFDLQALLSTSASAPFREVNSMQGLQGDLPQALQRFFETLTGGHSMQGAWVVILAVAAFLAGLIGERLRAQLARQAWQKRRWGEGGSPFKKGPAPVTDPAEQLRLVMSARFEKRRLLSRSEALVLYAAERAINIADLQWRVMAQVSLGEVLSSPDARAYSAINSKRVDLLIVSRNGDGH